jgi:replicative DNA helicase
MNQNSLWSLNLERAFIGGLIKKSDVYYQLDGFITENDFKEPLHGKIFSIIKQILTNQGTIDPIIVAQKVKEIGLDKIHDIPIFQYIDDITFTQITEKGLIEAAKELTKLRVRRELTENAEDVKKYVLENGSKSLSDLIGGVDKIYNSQIKQYVGDEEPTDLFAKIEEYILEIAKNPVEESGLKTPYDYFNRYFGGITSRNGIWNVISRSQEGKSCFLFNMAKGIAKINNVPVLYLDTEMSLDLNMIRASAAEAGINAWYLETGNWTKNQELAKKVQDSFPKFKELSGKFYHKYVPNMDIWEVLSVIRKWYHKNVGRNGKALVVYDYIKITGDSEKNRQEWQQLGDKVCYLNEIGYQLNIPILSAGQQNRSAEQNGQRIDDSTTAGASDRINQYAAFNAVFRKKTFEEITEFGTEFGTHMLKPFKTSRCQGKDNYNMNNIVRVKDIKGKTVSKQNFINYNIENYLIREVGTYKDIVNKQLLNRNLQDGHGNQDVDL